jgi:hypothetical protein
MLDRTVLEVDVALLQTLVGAVVSAIPWTRLNGLARAAARRTRDRRRRLP